MKRFLALMIVLTIALTVPSFTAVADNSSKGAVTIIVNGFTLETAVPPFIEKGIVMVPFRSIFEALGAVVNWDGAKQTITAERRSDAVITMQVGNRAGTIKQAAAPWKTTTKTLSVPPKIVNGITFIPVRFVSEAFGADVTWDGAANAVIIKSFRRHCPATRRRD